MSPFKSERQRKFMWSQHPDVAKKWSEEEKKKGKPAAKKKRVSKKKVGK